MFEQNNYDMDDEGGEPEMNDEMNQVIDKMADTQKYFAQHRSAMSSLQQMPQAYQALHDNGVNIDQTLIFDGTNNQASLMIDDMGLDIDLDDSKIRIEIDFTPFLDLLNDAYNKTPGQRLLSVFDDNDYGAQKSLSNTALNIATTQQLGVCVDMNVFDHMWVAKTIALGINTQSIGEYSRPYLLLNAESKRKGETYIGRTAASIIDKMYPLYVQNNTQFWGDRIQSSKVDKNLHLQTPDGLILERLSVGPKGAYDASKSLVLQGYQCLKTFIIPFKWFTEAAYARMDTPVPHKFTMTIKAKIGSYGDITRMVILPAPRAMIAAKWSTVFTGAPANVNDNVVEGKWLPGAAGDEITPVPETSGNMGRAVSDPQTVTNPFNGPRAYTLWDVNGAASALLHGPVQDDNFFFYPGEYGKPICEISQNPLRNGISDGAVLAAIAGAYRATIKATVLFGLMSKNLTYEGKEAQAQYYTDSNDETQSIRIDSVKLVPVINSLKAGILGDQNFLPSGQMGSGGQQLDTCDYYKVMVIVDSNAAYYNHTEGIRTITDEATLWRLFDEIVGNPWRTGLMVTELFDNLSWQLTQTSGRDHGLAVNRSGNIPLRANDDWFYASADFKSNFDIPAQTIGAYQSRAEITTAHGIPIRRFIPKLYVSAQFDSSMKTFNNQPPSKPRVPHVMRFALRVNKALPDPEKQYWNLVEDGVASVSHATGYKILIESVTTQTIFLYSTGMIDIVSSEEQP